MTTQTVFVLEIHLHDDDYGNALMERAAREAFADPQYRDYPLLHVHVIEHGGWGLTWAMVDGKMQIVGSANDRAEYHGAVREYRERVYPCPRVYLRPVCYRSCRREGA